MHSSSGKYTFLRNQPVLLEESDPSTVMLALGCNRERAVSGLRVSFSDEHQDKEIALFIAALREVVKELAPMLGKPSVRREKRR